GLQRPRKGGNPRWLLRVAAPARRGRGPGGGPERPPAGGPDSRSRAGVRFTVPDLPPASCPLPAGGGRRARGRRGAGEGGGAAPVERSRSFPARRGSSTARERDGRRPRVRERSVAPARAFLGAVFSGRLCPASPEAR